VTDVEGGDFWDFNSTIWEFKTEGFSQYWYSFLANWRGADRVGDELFSPADVDLTSTWATAKGETTASDERVLWPTSFLYSPVFWCRKERYGTHDEMKAEDLAVNLMSSVIHPSAKVLLWERADFGQQSTGATAAGSPAYNSAVSRTDVFMVDGSSDEVHIA